jgi:ATP-dependent protease ClpP protease subunit
MGAMIFAGLIVETLDEHPWLVVMGGASAGVVIDVSASNGPRRILEAALMFVARVRKIWTDRPPNDSDG